MADKFMYIPNDDKKLPHLLIKISGGKVWTIDFIIQNLLKSPKLLSQRIRNFIIKLWGLV